ncbi:hypothetical protein [Lysobacter claricitrinus]|uniref:hypothetical protein n=1 Tax=Lysobacter claricitrinus TaxID=3367728 RepID=UPI0037DB20B5
MNVDVRVEDDALVLRVEGDASLAQVRAAAFDAVLTCRDRGLRRLLIDVLDARIDQPPVLVQRIDIVQEWAEAAPDGFSIGLAAPEALLRPDRAGLYVASHLGLDARVFTGRAEAKRWLEQPSAQSTHS